MVISLCVGLGGSLDSKSIADFIDSGRDLILSADTSASDLIRGIATECGVDFDEVGFSECGIIFLLEQIATLGF